MSYSLSDNTWDENELQAIQRVLSKNFFTMDSEVFQYEKMFANKMGSSFAVMSNSGSSANLLMVAALIYSGKLKPYDEVIVPAVSWSTTYFPLAQFGLRLKFVDIDSETLNIDIEQLSLAITSNTKAIFCVNLLGNPNDYDSIIFLCEKYDLILLEDNCEALGGSYKNKYLGTFGIMGTFSTFYSHHLCTMEGGMTLTNEEALYHYMLCIRAHGWTRNLPANSPLYSKKSNDFYESYHFIMPGFNLRPLELEGAIGKEQLKKMDNIIQQRRENALFFQKQMKQFHNFRIQKEIGESSWFGFAIILTNRLLNKRDSLLERLTKEQIEVRPVVAGNFTRSPSIRYINYEIWDSLPHADWLHENGFFVGNHSKNIQTQIQQLIDILGDYE